MFGDSFYFLFSKTCFWEYKEKKQFSCIFEIKNMFGQLKLKKKKSFLKKKEEENTKIYCYQHLNFNANSLNETNSLN